MEHFLNIARQTQYVPHQLQHQNFPQSTMAQWQIFLQVAQRNHCKKEILTQN